LLIDIAPTNLLAKAQTKNLTLSEFANLHGLKAAERRITGDSLHTIEATTHHGQPLLFITAKFTGPAQAGEAYRTAQKAGMVCEVVTGRELRFYFNSKNPAHAKLAIDMVKPVTARKSTSETSRIARLAGLTKARQKRWAK